MSDMNEHLARIIEASFTLGEYEGDDIDEYCRLNNEFKKDKREFEAELTKLQAENKHLKRYRNAIAHIGVDFGYGEFVIAQKMIEQARAEEQSE